MSDRLPLLCSACYGDRDKQSSCSLCQGRGRTDAIAYADDPWNEIIPNLWVGGHDYRDWQRTSTEDLDSEGFEVVASLYQTFHSVPSLGVVHYTLRIPDGDLFDDEIERVYEMADLVAISVTEGKKTLVRCQAGLNRSALVAALAMVRMGYEPHRAIALIREKRSRFNLVNPHFVDIILNRAFASQEQP